MDYTFFDGHDELYHHAKFGEDHACTSVIVSGGVGMQQCMIRNQTETHKSQDCFKSKQKLLTIC